MWTWLRISESSVFISTPSTGIILEKLHIRVIIHKTSTLASLFPCCVPVTSLAVHVSNPLLLVPQSTPRTIPFNGHLKISSVLCPTYPVLLPPNQLFSHSQPPIPQLLFPLIHQLSSTSRSAQHRCQSGTHRLLWTSPCNSEDPPYTFQPCPRCHYSSWNATGSGAGCHPEISLPFSFRSAER